MGHNNEMMKTQVQRAEQYMDRSRGETARQALAEHSSQASLSGPVAL